MRTNITIESGQIEQLLRETKAKSKAKAVSIAIDEYLRNRRLAQITTLKGKLEFEMTAGETRHFER